MFKVIWLAKYRPDRDREDVRRWWRGQHADVGSTTPGMIRYVQNHWIAPLDPVTFLPVENGQLAFDGHADECFESREAFEAAMASEEWAATQLDGPVGFQPGGLVGATLEEHVVSWGVPTDEARTFKIIVLARFRPDRDREEVRRWWRGQHAEIAASTPGMIRYVQSHWIEPLDPATSLPAKNGQLAFDGHAEHWFESEEAYEAAMASDEWRATQLDGPVGFQMGGLVGARLDENVVTWDAAREGREYGFAAAR